jgi:DNA-directed RNA polymerase sigma subunit (sigma70/sigma32)
MSTFLWPSDGGWPYPDTGPEVTDPAAVIDDDMVSLLADSGHLLDGLDDLERQVITSHYGLDGQPARTMKQLHNDLGLSRAELRDVLGSGLEKLRSSLR